jgi:hypothetical protein
MPRNCQTITCDPSPIYREPIKSHHEPIHETVIGCQRFQASFSLTASITTTWPNVNN